MKRTSWRRNATAASLLLAATTFAWILIQSKRAKLSDFVPLEAFAGFSIESVEFRDTQAFPEYRWTLAYTEFDSTILHVFGFQSSDTAEIDFLSRKLKRQLGEFFRSGHQAEAWGHETDRHDTSILIQAGLGRAYVLVLKH